MLTMDQNNELGYTVKRRTILRVEGLSMTRASMCGVNDKFVYVTGGYSMKLGRRVAKCFRYAFDSKVWQEM